MDVDAGGSSTPTAQLDQELIATVVGKPRAIDGLSTQTGSIGTSGRYVALAEAGRGGLARVWRAYDTKLEREVALKVLHGDVLGERSVGSLQQEARAMAKLSHPNVVAVHDVAELDRHHLMLVLEYVAGTTLRQWVEQERRTWREIVGRFVDAGRGLVAAHGVGLLHRDFKPSNVLVSNRGVVKVTDFGLAVVTAEHTPSGSDPTSSVPLVETRGAATDRVIGTPRYMAPEQHAGAPLTSATDQYAFCVSLWEALCGAPPFPGRSITALAEAKRKGPPPWPSKGGIESAGTDVPRPIADALVRGLSPEAPDRWPTLNALLVVLSDHLENRSRWRWVTVGVVATAAVLAVNAASPDEAPCSGSEEQLAGVWDATREDAAEAR